MILISQFIKFPLNEFEILKTLLWMDLNGIHTNCFWNFKFYIINSFWSNHTRGTPRTLWNKGVLKFGYQNKKDKANVFIYVLEICIHMLFIRAIWDVLGKTTLTITEAIMWITYVDCFPTHSQNFRKIWWPSKCQLCEAHENCSVKIEIHLSFRLFKI